MLLKPICIALAAATTVAAQSFGQRKLMAAIQRNAEAQENSISPAPHYDTQLFASPVDHFHNDSRYEPHSNDTFNLRYWFDASYYKPGGPVVVYCAGEAAADGILKYLQKGIIHILAAATNGVGVILEHRYYGKSFPVPSLSTTEDYRFLTTDQAMADQAHFASNVVFPGLEQYNLTASHTPWIAYGGSYSGGVVSFLRTLYPDVFWGSISSSGVTHAEWDNGKYLSVVAKYGPPDCINQTRILTHAMDNILLHNSSNTPELKALWNKTAITDDALFMHYPAIGPFAFQSLNWDPAFTRPIFTEFCSNLTSNTILYQDYEAKQSSAEKMIATGGYPDEAKDLAPHLLNWIGYINQSVRKAANISSNDLMRVFEVQGNTTELSDQYSWVYQTCTQWGYMLGTDSVPADELPIISRLITTQSQSALCRTKFNLTEPAKTDEINKYGGYNISYPRLARSGGEWDPWRPFTPLADEYLDKPSSTDEPRIMISQGVHHWDSNGLFPNETTAELPPQSVKDAHSQEVEFVKAWVQEYQEQHPKL